MLNIKKALRKHVNMLFAHLRRFLEAPGILGHVLQDVRLHLLAIVLERQRRWALAEETYRQAIVINASAPRYYDGLARTLRKQKKRWQEIEALENATRLRPNNSHWRYRLGQAYQAMGRMENAASAYEVAAKLRPRKAQWQYRYGLALEALGDIEGASEAYALAIRVDPSGDGQRFGVGAFHQKLGLWEEAGRAYAEQLNLTPLVPELHYRHGLSHERCYRWQQAADAYERALATPLADGRWHGRLGLVYSRLNQWLAASTSYARAAAQSYHLARFWNYRTGDALVRAGQYQDACSAFLRMWPLAAHEFKAQSDLPEKRIAQLHSHIQTDYSAPDVHRELGEHYERTGQWDLAASAYSDALARLPQHDSQLYFRLGFVLVQLVRYEEASEAFLCTRLLRRHHGASDTKFRQDRTFQRTAHYTEYTETLLVKDKVIFYESFHGRSMACNPLAIFLTLLDCPDFRDWTHVWALKDTSTAPPKYRSRANVVFVQRESELYLRYLATAKYLINNTSFSSYFVRRPEQFYVNTWHGTPLKTLGRDVGNTFIEWKNISRNLLQTTHILSPNPHTTKVLTDSHNIGGCYRGIVAETGYPRIDTTLNLSADDVTDLKRRLGINDTAKVVLYAPTYRGTVGDASFDLSRVSDDIQKLSTIGCHVLFRGHYFVEKHLTNSAMHNTVVPDDIDTNVLLGIVDVLVTDYSSIAVDFLSTRRPIVFYVFDLEEYCRDRGLYFSIDVLPGDKCFHQSELLTSVSSSLRNENRYALQYDHALATFCPREDGQSTQRVIDMVFFGRTEGVALRPQDPRKSLLFYAGTFFPHGITASLLNLLAQIDATRYSVTLVVEPDRVKASEDRMEQFKRLPPHVQVIARTGRMNVTIDERWVIDKFSAQNNLASEKMSHSYELAFRREAKRVFGNAHFDTVINFDGYSHFWTSLLGCIERDHGIRSVIYQHNDMCGEWKTKYPSLEGTFREYRHYDAIVSVSKRTRDRNVEQLVTPFSLDASKHVFCDNVVDCERIIRDSRIVIDDEAVAEYLQSSGPKFITIGRLSPEKDHAKLIRAIARLRANNTDIKLLILGDGPLRTQLQALIQSQDLANTVYLAGRRSNPFPYMTASDCFVFPSLYEGQGLVLLEALVLKLPIICTDFPSAHDVLGEEHGLIVENSEDGLVDGMSRFLRRELTAKVFDRYTYQRTALSSFYNTVLDDSDPENSRI